jgi:DNA polymerase-3 subunit delta
MTPGELKKALRERRFPSLLFLHGEERFFLERSVESLLDLTVPPEWRDFNLTVFHGREAGVGDILDCARTLPVFHDYRLVLVRDAHLMAAAELEKLTPYLKEPVPETVLVFVADKIDSRRKFFKEFKKYGQLVEFKKYYDNQIPDFVLEYAREAGVAFSEEGLKAFCRRVGSSLPEIAGELDKLFNFLGERKLADVEDVRAIVSDIRVDSVFDLADALGQQQRGRALVLLNRLLDEGVAPLVILAMVARHLRQLWKARHLLDRGEERKSISRIVGVNPYFLDGVLRQARSFPVERFPGIFEEMLAADLALKSSGAHPSAILEELVFGITAGKNPA